MNDDIEHVLLVIKEVHVFKVPPRTTARGYRAEEWNNNLVWTGRMRIIAKGKDCNIQLEDGTTGELFAKCLYDLDGTSVEAVIDSSRYFVIKIVDPGSGKHAFIGIGFPERSWAFDFNVALQDHVKRVRQENVPVKVSNEPAVDYSLKQGQTISIALSGVKKNGKPVTSGPITLAPPPSHSTVASTVSVSQPSSATPISPNNASGFTGWTTF